MTPRPRQNLSSWTIIPRFCQVLDRDPARSRTCYQLMHRDHGVAARRARPKPPANPAHVRGIGGGTLRVFPIARLAPGQTALTVRTGPISRAPWRALRGAMLVCAKGLQVSTPRAAIGARNTVDSTRSTWSPTSSASDWSAFQLRRARHRSAMPIALYSGRRALVRFSR